MVPAAGAAAAAATGVQRSEEGELASTLSVPGPSDTSTVAHAGNDPNDPSTLGSEFHIVDETRDSSKSGSHVDMSQGIQVNPDDTTQAGTELGINSFAEKMTENWWQAQEAKLETHKINMLRLMGFELPIY